MLLLAIDTSGKHGSIALAQGKADGTCKTIQLVPLEGGTFSAQLVPQIAALLEGNNFSKSDIDAFAVVSGPGSFTGLRVGLAAVKALAEILQKPIAAVSLLEAVAQRSSRSGVVIAVLDAGRAEAYRGEYERKDLCTVCLQEELVGLQEMARLVRNVVTPDENIAEFLAGHGTEVELVDRPLSDAIAALGWRKVIKGETVSPEALDANYIRRSDAEIFSRTL